MPHAWPARRFLRCAQTARASARFRARSGARPPAMRAKKISTTSGGHDEVGQHARLVKAEGIAEHAVHMRQLAREERGHAVARRGSPRRWPRPSATAAPGWKARSAAGTVRRTDSRCRRSTPPSSVSIAMSNEDVQENEADAGSSGRVRAPRRVDIEESERTDSRPERRRGSATPHRPTHNHDRQRLAGHGQPAQVGQQPEK